MTRRASLPRLVIFGDPDKGPVAEAMREFSLFLQDKARIIASCHIRGNTGSHLELEIIH